MEAPPHTQHILHRIARWFVAGAVVMSPWLFGSAEPWAYLVVNLCATLGVIVWLFSLVVTPQFGIRAGDLGCVLLLVLLFIFFQSSRFPCLYESFSRSRSSFGISDISQISS